MFLVLTEPPYVVKEQGYAGFTILIEVFFKGVPDNDNARKVDGNKTSS
jgi:transcription initiation factor IIF auxiliary subunit